MARRQRIGTIAGVFGAGLGLSLVAQTAAAATWPVWRGNKERTATVAGELGPGSPQLTFRMPLGGEPTRAVVFPKTMPGKVLTAVGGQVRATDVITGRVEWQSPMLSELTLVGSADLDGDDVAEAVAFTRRQAFVFSGVDGSVIWQSVLSEHSTISAVRLADVTGDGLSEVLIDDCATCGVPGPLMGEVVTFAGGEALTLWTILASDVPYHYHQGTDAVLFGLGSGRPLLGLPTIEDYRLADGATGEPLVIIPRGNYWFAQTSAMVADPSHVLLLRATGNAKGALPPVVINLEVSPDEGAGRVAWQYAGDVYATLELSETSAHDLDGDGTGEVVLSEFSGDGQWSLVILDADTGAVEHRSPGWKLEGVVNRVHLGESLALVVTGEAGLSLAKYQDGEFTPIGNTLANWEAAAISAPDSLVVSPVRGALPLQSAAGATTLLVGQTATDAADRGGRYQALGLVSLDDAGLQLQVSRAPSHPVTAVFPANSATRPYAQFAIGTTDGAVTVLDQHLAPSSGSLFNALHQKEQRGFWWFGAGETDYLGTPVGGRQPTRTHLIGKQDDAPFVVVPGTADGTVIADARNASLVTAPAPWWSSPGLTKPSVFEAASGSVVAGVEATNLVLKQARSGELVASAPLDVSALGPLGAAFNEPLLLSRNEGTPIVALDWQLPAAQVAQRGFAWSEEGLSEAWTSEPMSWGGGFFSSAGRYQFDASAPSSDVLVFATNNQTQFRRGDTGQSFTKSVYTGHYTLPIFADFTGDGATDLLFQSGFVSPWLYGPNWAPAWQKSDPLPTYGMAGALIPCAAGARYVTPFLRSPRFIVHDAVTGNVVADQVAASGALFASELEAQAAGALAGFLSNMSVLETPEGSLIVFGSTDGRLYAVNGCGQPTLVWALDAGTPLGEPSIGDWDGDGKEELLVGASSGHLLGVDFGRLPAPEVTLGHTSHRSARVRWSAVEGAAAYEYALVTPAGAPVWSPAYRKTRGTHAHIDLDRTLAGRPFRVAVRAINGQDCGNDGFSPPVSLTDVRPPQLQAGYRGEDGLWFAAVDNQALDHFLVFGVDEDGSRVWLDDGFLSGRFAPRSWAIPSAADEFPSLVIAVVDAAGNRTELRVDRPSHHCRRYRHLQDHGHHDWRRARH